MGSIGTHDVAWYMNKYDLSVFLETGTWKGNGVKIARRFPFEHILSVDISPKHFKNNVNSIQNNDDRVKLFVGDSPKMLPEMLTGLEDKKILFWLDAHFPDIPNKNKLTRHVILPLEREIKILKSLRDVSGDVFIIDDLRVYEYHKEIRTNSLKPGVKSKLGFLEGLLDTHELQRDFRNEGYVILVPRN